MVRLISFFTLLMIFGATSLGYSQFRDQQPTEYDYTGSVIKKSQATPGNWAEQLNVTMSHSYSMTFASVGGQYQNLNMYTNTMLFDMGPKLTGRLDVSLSHSPFGPSNMYGPTTSNGTDAEIFIRNAELNFKISDKMQLHIQYQQLPTSAFYSPFYNGYNDMNPFYGRTPFDH